MGAYRWHGVSGNNAKVRGITTTLRPRAAPHPKQHNYNTNNNFTGLGWLLCVNEQEQTDRWVFLIRRPPILHLLVDV